MTRVVLVIGQLGLGGAEKQLCQLATGLPQWNYHPLVISLSAGGEREQDLRTHGIELHVLSRDRSFDVKRLLQTVNILRDFQPQIVHGFDYVGSIYGRLAGVITGMPILIGGVRAEWIPPKRILYIERLLRRKTDAVISNSCAGKQAWAKLINYPEEKIAVVPNGFSFGEMEQLPSGFRPLHELLGLPADAPVIGCIGSICHRKNPLMFVDVAAIVITPIWKARASHGASFRLPSM